MSFLRSLSRMIYPAKWHERTSLRKRVDVSDSETHIRRDRVPRALHLISKTRAQSVPIKARRVLRRALRRPS